MIQVETFKNIEELNGFLSQVNEDDVVKIDFCSYQNGLEHFMLVYRLKENDE